MKTASTTVKDSNGLLWLVAIAVFMETLDSTIVNTAIPSMASDLGVSPIHMYAVSMSYALTLALLIPASGWIADRFGIRRMFMNAIIVFSIGSLCCALSQTFFQLIASRVLQGIGGSMLLPLGRLAVLRSFPKDKYLAAISFVAIPGMVGPLVGPIIGGILVEAASWHWIFLINLPIGLIGYIATPRFMPIFQRFQFARFDTSGFIMLATFMLTISLALEGLSGLALPTAAVIVLALVGLAGLISYGLHASAHHNPLFSLNLFKDRTFTLGLAANLFSRVGTGGMPFLIPLLLQVGFQLSPVHAALTMVPMALTAVLSKRSATKIIMAMGYKKFLLTNTVAVGIMIMSFALVTETQPIVIRVIQLSIFGFFNSLQFSALNSLTLKNLDERNASSGNSLFSMVQMLAMSFGVACAGSLLTIFSQHNVGGAIDATETLHAFKATFLVLGIITCVTCLIFVQLSSDTKPPREAI